MNADVLEWLKLAARWIHVFAGILWVGQTFLFSRLERSLGRDSKVWMIHSGGFYVVDQGKPSADALSKIQWFRWEAAFTWLSGMFLLVVMYHLSSLMLTRDGTRIEPFPAIGMAAGGLAAAWVVYDLLWLSPLGRWEWLGTVLSFVLLMAGAWGLFEVLDNRAVYIHVGAMLGTLMAANVWMRIIPAQRRMVAAIREGKAPDEALAARAKQRSKHNMFMVLPVVAIMVSNHFSTITYGHEHNWAILGGLVLAGWAGAKVLRSL